MSEKRAVRGLWLSLVREEGPLANGPTCSIFGLNHRPDLFFVGSTNLNVIPLVGVGGNGSPRTTVTSMS